MCKIQNNWNLYILPYKPELVRSGPLICIIYVICKKHLEHRGVKFFFRNKHLCANDVLLVLIMESFIFTRSLNAINDTN